MNECQNHKICIQDALSKAELICKERNLRFTDLRQKVLKIISQNHHPAKAYDILTQLQKEDASAKPSTVYRTLDFLLEYGLIHKLQSSSTYISCSHPTTHNQCYFLVCDQCKEIKECCDNNLTQTVHDVAKNHHFKTKNIIIEISGLCEVCASN